MENQTLCNKTSFATEDDAGYYIDKLSKTSKRKDVPVRAYLCTRCHCWHLTKKSEFANKEVSDLKLEIRNLKLEVERLTVLNRNKHTHIENIQKKTLSRKVENRKLVLEMNEWRDKYIRLVRTNLDKNNTDETKNP